MVNVVFSIPVSSMHSLFKMWSKDAANASCRAKDPTAHRGLSVQRGVLENASGTRSNERVRIGFGKHRCL